MTILTNAAVARIKQKMIDSGELPRRGTHQMTEDLDALIERMNEAAGVQSDGKSMLLAQGAEALEALREELAEEKRQTKIMLDSYAAENQRISDERERAREALRKVQWAEFNDSDYGSIMFCQECRFGPETGHHNDCSVLAALAAKEPKHG